MDFRIEQDRLFESSFAGFEAPPASVLRESSHSRVFANVPYESLWRATLRVLTQRGILVHASWETGLIVCVSPTPRVKGRQEDQKPRKFIRSGFPSAVLLERSETGETVAYGDWILDLYRRADAPERFAIGITEEAKEAMAALFFESLEVEALASMRWSRKLTGSGKKEKR